MAVAHRYTRRNSLQFTTFPLGLSGQELSVLRLPDVFTEAVAEGAHAAMCVWRPSRTAGEETASAALSTSFVFGTGDVMPDPAPVVTHSAGPSQSIARLRGIEMRLDGLEAATVTASVTVTVTIVWSGGGSTVIPLQITKGGQTCHACLTFPPGKTATGLTFYIENPALKLAEISVLAIGDAAP